jgi:hypothetical protein
MLLSPFTPPSYIFILNIGNAIDQIHLPEQPFIRKDQRRLLPLIQSIQIASGLHQQHDDLHVAHLEGNVHRGVALRRR